MTRVQLDLQISICDAVCIELVSSEDAWTPEHEILWETFSTRRMDLADQRNAEDAERRAQ